MSRVELIVLHCTDTPQSMRVTKNMLENWGRERGWRRQLLGYKGLVHQTGELEVLVPDNGDEFIDPWEITNGARGYNHKAWHYAYAGGKGGDTRTIAQVNTMAELCTTLAGKYNWLKIAGHDQLSSKACPSFDVPSWLRSIGLTQHIYKV